jgi:hypothetical protein
MPSRNLPRDVLNAVNRKTGKSIAPSDIQKLASTVKPSTVQSEAQLRQLIKNVAKMANVPVSESTVQDIVRAVRQSGLNPQNLEKMIGAMLKK